MSWSVYEFPPSIEWESKTILRSLPPARSALAELKGIAQSMPNQAILLNTLPLQEAKDSSAIENIITTHDELFKASLQSGSARSSTAKEVQGYAKALTKGFELIQKKVFTSNDIISIQRELEGNSAGFRKLPGTSLKNATTGQTIYTPPQDFTEILKLMSGLEKFINDDMPDIDPLIKMAIIHFQFESVHPFYDGNGRTGRIINILYLVLKDLLNLPILYLSRYIIKNKPTYYQLLQKVRDQNEWQDWILFMIQAVENTSRYTIRLVLGLKELMMDFKHALRSNYKFYSQDLLNNLFNHPYTKIEFVMNELNVSRITAANYLNQLSNDGYLEKHKMGKENYYVNTRLFGLLTNPED